MTENLNWLTRFREVYKPLLKNHYDDFEEALQADKKRHVRFNISRGVDYLSEFNAFNLKAVSGLKGLYEVNACPEKVTDTLSFQTGGVYIMNPSSVVPPMILSSFMPKYPIIMDVSAAPGGKTCALSDFLNRRGLIIANEISSSRLKSLHFNLEKYGCYNVKTVSRDGRLMHKTFENSFDGILLDAPCSNENKIFRNKTVQHEWGKVLVERMAALQKPMILSAFDCLKDGGTMVYSTCTMSVEENEGVVEYLLNERSSAKLVKIEGYSGGGFSKHTDISEKVIRIIPSRDTMDGFFIAVFRKGEYRGNEKIPMKTKINKVQEKFFQNNFDFIPSNISISEFDGRGYLEPSLNPFKKIPFSRRGLNVYRVAKKDLEPTCQAVWEFGVNLRQDTRSNINFSDAIEYLKGFDIPKPHKYNVGVLFSRGIPIGYGKIVNDSLKNKLDRYFLFGKNIEW